ncbi:MAG: chorismate synthase [Planctomycetota bacterium]
MNTFGKLFRIAIFGESHGECVGVLVDGCPAGFPIADNDFLPDLARRKSGAPGTTPRRESDIPFVKSGVFNEKTTGAPILILFGNKDADSQQYQSLKHAPRPGHADFTAFKKFGGFNDYRGGGQFSGRLTAGLVAAGVIAKKVIDPVRIKAQIVETGGLTDINTAVESAVKNRDSIGGIVECKAKNLPVGLGEPFFDSVESLLSHAVFSIPGIKGLEFGAGFACGKMMGSKYNDEILEIGGKTKTNNSGGINGGITNGNELIFRVAVRPTASIPKIQKTINLKTGEPMKIAVSGRHDACIALRVPVILESITAVVIADLMLLEQKIHRVKR